MQKVVIDINGEMYQGEVEDRKLLVDFLRDDLKLTGTKVGCAHGVCGSCTVHLDGVPIRSCLKFAVQADGGAVRTVESLANSDGSLNALQRAFRESHGLQCGFCTPGILMTATALMESDAELDEKKIREAVSGNICRCTGYESIVAAIALAIRTARTVGTE